MTYTRNSSLTGRGTATGTQIQAWLETRAPGGAAYVKLPQVPIPDGLGDAIYEESAVYGLNQDLIAAQVSHESAAAQSRIARDKNNYSGYGAENDDPYGKAHTFATPRDGIRVQIAHLMGYIAGDGPWNALSPRYSIVKQNGWDGTVSTPGQLEQKWAWSKPSDYNSTPVSERYGSKLATLANRLLTFAATYTKEEPPVSKPIIALASGHHNTNKGGAVGEYERVGPLTREIAKQLRANGGFDVRVITPDDGMGDFPGGLQDVAREAVRLNARCFLEVHMEGVGNTAVRGCFAIYPDWGDDVDADVRDKLGPNMAGWVKASTGLPLRGNGTMSEKATGVGGQGHRLGAFGASASARATMERLIFEYGTLTNVKDRAIIDGAGFNTKAAQATVVALAAFYGVKAAPREPEDTTPDKPHPDARLFPETGQYIMLGFKEAWEQFNDDARSIAVFGYPLTGEVKDGELTIQYFERAVFEWHPGTGVLLRRLGAEELGRAA